MSDSFFTIEVKRHKHKSVSVQELILDGHLDHEFVDRFREKIGDLIDEKKHFIILNLEKLDVIDESGSGAIISAKTKCQIDGGALIIIKPSKNIKMVMGFVHFDKLTKVFDSLEEGLEYFSRIGL